MDNMIANTILILALKIIFTSAINLLHSVSVFSIVLETEHFSLKKDRIVNIGTSRFDYHTIGIGPTFKMHRTGTLKNESVTC